VNQVAYCSYTSRLHVTEKAHGHSIRFSEIVGARIGTLYYGLGKVIAGLAGIRSFNDEVSSPNRISQANKTFHRELSATNGRPSSNWIFDSNFVIFLLALNELGSILG
jgi:hypothetical protein